MLNKPGSVSCLSSARATPIPDPPPDATPIGTVASLSSADSPVITFNRPTDLRDQERIRLTGASNERIAGYVRRVGDNSVTLHADSALTKPLRRDGLRPGMVATRLAADHWAIVIALNYYWYPGLKALRGALRDAELFASWVTDMACVPDDQLFTIEASKSPLTDQASGRPTTDTVADAFVRLYAEAKSKPGMRLGQRLYIFCSGHGAVPLKLANPDFREAALLLAGATPDNNFARHVPTRGYAEYFRASGIFDEVILLVDCCRDLKNNVPLNPVQLPEVKLERREGRQFYAAPTGLGLKSWEQELGEPKEWRGVFSYALIDALNDPTVCDDQGYLTGSKLRDHLYVVVPELTDKQDASIDYDPKRGEIVLIKRRDFVQPVAVISFAPNMAGQVARIYRSDARSLIYRETVPLDLVLTVNVGKNQFYKVVVDDPAVERYFEGKYAVNNVSLA